MNQEFNMLVPMVVQRTSNGERSMDIFSRLLEERVIMINGQVTDEMSSLICAQLLYLENQDSSKDIHVYINSPGGSVTAGLAMFDTMQFIKPDITTVVTGMAASMGSFLATCGGTKGKRFVLQNARTMIHQPSGGYQGQSTDIEIHTREILRMREQLERIYAESTGRTYEEIHKACDRDNYKTAQEAVDFGLADEILTSNTAK